MSDIKNQLDTDILNFFKNIETQSVNDQVQTLKNLFNKHLHLHTCDHKMDYYDLMKIVNLAKGKFADRSFPVYLGDPRKLVPQNELTNLCVIECVVEYLNQNDCLKKMPKFDYKEDKF